MIKELYVIQKFQQISEALGLDLELLELKIKKDQHDKGGAFHIRTKPRTNDTYEILKSFKDFKELEQFLQSFEKELNKFSMRQIIND